MSWMAVIEYRTADGYVPIVTVIFSMMYVNYRIIDGFVLILPVGNTTRTLFRDGSAETSSM